MSLKVIVRKYIFIEESIIFLLLEKCLKSLQTDSQNKIFSRKNMIHALQIFYQN